MKIRKLPVGICSAVIVAMSLAGPHTALAAPSRPNIDRAIQAAERGDASQLGEAYRAVYNVFDVDGMLRVAQTYKRVGNEFMARQVFEQACNVAISWAYYSGYDAKGGDWRYAEEVLPRVIRAAKMYATDGDTGTPRQAAQLALAQLREENRRGAPRVIAGLWASSKRETRFQQDGLKIRASNGAMTLVGEMRINGDWVYIVGHVKKKNGESGSFTGRLHLRQSNVMHTTIIYKDDKGVLKRFHDQIRRP